MHDPDSGDIAFLRAHPDHASERDIRWMAARIEQLEAEYDQAAQAAYEWSLMHHAAKARIEQLEAAMAPNTLRRIADDIGHGASG